MEATMNNNYGKGKDNLSKNAGPQGGQGGSFDRNKQANLDKNKQQPNQGGQGGYGKPQGNQQNPQQQKQPWGGQTDRHGDQGAGGKHK